MNVFFRIIFLLIAVNGFALRQRCKLPDGITGFEYMRLKNFCYVDKTGFISKMLETELKFFFIARPRKLGKSLFCRTIESVLWGKKQLFEDLSIINATHDWNVYPVIYLDFSSFGLQAENSKDYSRKIIETLQKIPNKILEKYQDKVRNPEVRIHADVTGNKDSKNETDVQSSLENLICSMQKAFSSDVAIVVDEYDSFITSNLHKPKLVSQVCTEVLRPFYAKVKFHENELRFVFVTGVARFTQSYLFSSMNNLNDISQDEDYSDMLGFTVDEMKFFEPEIEAIVEYRKKKWGAVATMSSEYDEVRNHYDGYRFTAGGPSVFHPSFLMTYLRTKNHQVVKGKIPEPKYLFDLLPRQLYSTKLLIGINVTSNNFGMITDPQDIKLAPLLYHTGIFSIKNYDPYSDTYFLNYPNKFVAEYFQNRVLMVLTEPLGFDNFERFDSQCNRMMSDLVIGDEVHVKKYFEQLNILSSQRGYDTFPREPGKPKEEDPQKDKKLSKRDANESKMNEHEEEKEQPKSVTSTKRGRGRPTTRHQSKTQNTQQTNKGLSRLRNPKPEKLTKMEIYNRKMEDYYFQLEGAYQFMLRICFDVCRIGYVSYERHFSAGRDDIEYLMPSLSKVLVCETKAGVGNAEDALDQLLKKYAKAYLNFGRELICMAVSFSKETRMLEDWIYVQYDEKGNVQKIFAHEQHDVEELKSNLHDISIT